MRKIDASYRVMKLFKMLYERPLSLDEICDGFYMEDICINRETVSKYFKTLRRFGCKVGKRFGKFELKSVPFSLDLSDDDFYYLAIFQNLATDLYGESVCQNLKAALSKILLLTDYNAFDKYDARLLETRKISSSTLLFRDKIAKLLKFGYENSKIKILYNDRKINISHISFKYCDNAVFAHVFNEDTKSYELLMLDGIKEIYSTPESSFGSEFAPYTVFALSGRLKNSYTLYEGEKVIKMQEDKVLISNNFEDKNELFRRLLRYGNLCQIISPKGDVEKFRKMLENMKNNLKNKTLS